VRFLGRESFLLPVVIVTLAAVVMAIPLQVRRAKLAALRERQESQLNRLRRLKERKESLMDRRRRLLSEPAAIERVAREDYGFAAPGEFAVPADTSRPQPEPPPKITLPTGRWDRVLGNGNYPWIIPAAAFLFTALLMGVIELTSGRPGEQRTEGAPEGEQKRG
jgi:cell division protein FtsB